MSKIRVLSEDIINKIAAGEVIERPASVVKEFVENAIDAGAAHISIEVIEGGKSFIKVSDDGCGIEKEDVVISIQRHTTSKIDNLQDLFQITTLGFRGEALASIASIAKLEMITKTKESDVGVSITVENGNGISIINEEGFDYGVDIILDRVAVRLWLETLSRHMFRPLHTFQLPNTFHLRLCFSAL